jgi:hypothetical protein
LKKTRGILTNMNFLECQKADDEWHPVNGSSTCRWENLITIYQLQCYKFTQFWL